MDGGGYKLYHEHDFDTRDHLEKYFSNMNVFVDDSVMFPMDQLHQLFNEGHIKGDLLIDLSFSSPVHHLYSASGCFQQIVVLKFNEKCLMELNRWINTRTGAFDWTHASEYITELEQAKNRDPVHEMRLKTAMVKTIKCDLRKENITDPVVLPPADCIISDCLLDVISKDQDDYISNFKTMSKLLKRGGHLLLLGLINSSYITILQHKYHMFKYDEEFTKKVLIGEGFTIKSCNVQKRKAESDLIDYEGIFFINAQKN